MINDSYLKDLAKSSCIEEFKLKCAILYGSDDISAIEEDYCNRIKDCKVYNDEFLKDK